MQNVAAALTMVRDDLFFLRAWLRHYGGILGLEHCYVVNHGRGAEVARLAVGANLIGIPGDPHPAFDQKRWRLLTNLVMGLRAYYTHVIVGDVDELVIRDPAHGGLLDLLAGTPGRRVLTPVGLELVHRRDLEHDPPEPCLLGPRMHVRPAPHYSKPCIVSVGTKLSRGGHFTRHDRLEVPEGLYLLHLKYCDFDIYRAGMDRRNAMAATSGAQQGEVGIGAHWFAAARGSDAAVFEAFAGTPLEPGFDLAPLRQRMRDSFRPRGTTGYFECDRPEIALQYRLPDRFAGVI